MGASKAMIIEAVTHFRSKQIPPKRPPSERWFHYWLKRHSESLYTIKTKPIAKEWVESHSTETIASNARIKQSQKLDQEHTKALDRARRDLQIYVNEAKSKHHAAGVEESN